MIDCSYRVGVTTRCPVEDSSQVSLARSVATTAGALAGFAPKAIDRIALVATELAENLHRHAMGGELIAIASGGPDGEPALTLIAIDRGPGVADFERCVEDGYSTAGTMGTGLGSVRRLATVFDAVSEPAIGTVVTATFLTTDPMSANRRGPELFDVAAMGWPIDFEDVSGDSWIALQRGRNLTVVVADGLGHGRDAALASTTALDAATQINGGEPGDVLLAVNDRLRGTRGAAVTVARLDLETARSGGEIMSSGLGNVSLLVAGRDSETRRVVTSHGTAGARVTAKVSQQSTAFPAAGILILHTDGLTSRWSLTGRTELLKHTAQVIAAALWRDYIRGSDDSLIVVVKLPVTRAADDD